MSFHRSPELRAAAARPSILRTVVWVSIAFVMLALSSPLQAQGHRARLSRGLAEAIGGGWLVRNRMAFEPRACGGERPGRAM